MPSSSYQPAPSSVEEYLQQLMQKGFLAAAAIAHLIREVHEGYIETDIPLGSYVSWPDPDGCFFVETAAGPPVRLGITAAASGRTPSASPIFTNATSGGRLAGLTRCPCALLKMSSPPANNSLRLRLKSPGKTIKHRKPRRQSTRKR